MDFLQLMINARRSGGDFEDIEINDEKEIEENHDENLQTGVRKGQCKPTCFLNSSKYCRLDL